MRQNNRLKAQTLLYVGFALLSVVIVAAVVMTAMITIQKTTSYQRKGMDAHQLAMAGVERAKAELKHDWNWPGLDDIVIDDDPNRGTADDETIELGEGEYWVDLEDIDSNQKRIFSHGWIGDAHKMLTLDIQGAVPCGACCELADQIDIPVETYFAKGSSGAIVAAIRHDINRTVDPTQIITGPAYEAETCLRACNVLGYASWSDWYWHAFSSCDDDWVANYDAATDSWRVDNGCIPGGYNKRLRCFDRMPRCSNNLDDDGDCLIDYLSEATPVGPPPTDSLVLHYPFDVDFNDTTINGNNGAPQGNTLLVPGGIIGQAAYLDGSGDWIDIGNLDANFTDEATLSMWVRLDNAVPGYWQTGLADLGESSRSHYPYVNNDLYINVFRNDRLPAIANSGFDKSQWHMLTIVNEPGADGYRIYQDMTVAYTGTGENSITLNTGGNEELGRGPYIPSINWYFYLQGLIDEVRIYNRALNQDEIRNIYYSNPAHTFTTPCSDGVDNDRDGFTDYCLADGSNAALCDSGCASEYDINEITHDSGCDGPLDEDERGGTLRPGEVRILSGTWSER